MSSILACSGCGKRYKAPAQLAGKRLRCKCGEIITVPVPRPVRQPVPSDMVMPEELDLSSASGLLSASGFIPEAGRMINCPSCSVPMSPEAVLCTACGFNTATGKKLHGVKEKKSKAAPLKPEPKKETPVQRQRDDGMPTLGAKIWKLSTVVIILAALAAAGYYIRGAIRHNPTAEAKDIQAKIYPGMSIAEVVKVTERPPREAWTEEIDKNGAPKRVPLHYSETFMTDYPPERLADGFSFAWRYSERAILHVFFTEEGKVHSSQIVNPMAALGM